MVPIETIRKDWDGYREMILEARESRVLFGKGVMGLYQRLGPGRWGLQISGGAERDLEIGNLYE